MHSISLPSGLSGAFREMKVTEERILSDRRLTKSGEFADQLLRACWIRTDDLAIYEAAAGGHPDWSKVLVGDRFVALIKIRCETHGSDFAFRVPCSACKERIDWRIDLDRDLKVKPYSPEALARFQRGEAQETRVLGPLVKFGLLTGADERRLKQLRSGSLDEPLSFAILARVQEVEGVEKSAVRAWVKDLGLRSASALLSAFEEPEGGIDTTIEIYCPHSGCGVSQDVDLPFDSDFWMPKRKAGK